MDRAKQAQGLRASENQGLRASENKEPRKPYTSTFDGKSHYVSRLMVVLDLSIVVLVYALTVTAYPFFRPGETLDMGVHFGLLPFIIVGFMASRALVSNRTDIQRQTVYVQTVAILQELLLALAFVIFAIFLLKLDDVSRAVIVVFFASSFLTMFGVRRLVFWWYISRQIDAVDSHLKVLIIGSGRRAHLLADQLQQS